MGNAHVSRRELLAQIEALSSLLLFDPMRRRIIEQLNRPLAEHLDEYEAVMHSRGGSKHVRDATRRLRVMVKLCRVKTFADLSKSKIEVACLKLRAIRITGCHRVARKSRTTFSSATLNHYLNSLKGFCNWMVNDGRAERSPCLGLRRLPATDIRKKRRALSSAEILRLFESATNGRTIGGVPGAERALSYILSTTTGLRSKEIQSLTRTSFELDRPDGPRVIVQPGYTKNKKPAEQPLRADVAELIRAYLRQTPRSENLFRRPANAMHAVRADLRAAGIEYRVNGEDADFHAQRHTFVSNLFDSGATPKEAQILARHQDARLTLGRYAHVTTEKKRAAVERLPAITIPRTDAGDRSETERTL